MTEMRVLTVRQPWAAAIIHAGKDVENRVRNIAGDYRGPVAIHAGKVIDEDAPFPGPGHMRPVWGLDFDYGHIIGVVDLVGVHVCKSHSGKSDVPVCFKEGVPYAVTCSPWAQFTRGERTHHIELARSRPLAEPIPYRGALGLRRLDSATQLLVESELT